VTVSSLRSDSLTVKQHAAAGPGEPSSSWTSRVFSEVPEAARCYEMTEAVGPRLHRIPNFFVVRKPAPGSPQRRPPTPTCGG
jgi:hypothetical protein